MKVPALLLIDSKSDSKELYSKAISVPIYVTLFVTYVLGSKWVNVKTN